MRTLLFAVLLAGCSDPVFSLRFRLTGGESQQCYSDEGDVTTKCEDVTMLCDAYLSVRIINPEDPAAPYISMCEPLADRQPTLCAIAGPDLPAPAMPVSAQTLEVQVAIFPASAILADPNTGAPVCPLVEYAANGLPMAAIHGCDEIDPFACPRVPAVGGRAFYQPGDEKTVVDLGCTDVEQLSVCTDVNRTDVTVTVNDFDVPVASVDKPTADRLIVGVGEPTPLGDTYVLAPGDSFDLERSMAATPSWSGVFSDLELTNVACAEVREDGPGTTSTLTCEDDDIGEDDVSIAGYFLRKTTLAQVISAIGMSTFPDTGGLVVGMVVDHNFAPLAGAEVSCSGCPIQYINATRTGTVSGATTSSGMFVSTEATFGTVFSTSRSGPLIDMNAASGIGGTVEGKVTIVVLQIREIDPM